MKIILHEIKNDDSNINNVNNNNVDNNINNVKVNNSNNINNYETNKNVLDINSFINDINKIDYNIQNCYNILKEWNKADFDELLRINNVYTVNNGYCLPNVKEKIMECNTSTHLMDYSDNYFQEVYDLMGKLALALHLCSVTAKIYRGDYKVINVNNVNNMNDINNIGLTSE